MIPPLWMLAAALAVAYLLWSRPAAPAGLPPLSPLPAPLVPPPAPAAAGVSPLLLGAILLPWCLVAWTHLVQTAPAPTPPAPAPVSGLDLRGRFVGPDAATDAGLTAALLEELADAIAFDGSQAEPRLRTGAAFDDLRRAARELRTRGVSLGARQPAVRDAIKTYLDAQVGTDGGPVDAAQRAAWVAAFKAVAQAAAEASR